MVLCLITIHGSWRNSYDRIERYPDSASRHDAKPGIVYHGMCTSAFVHYPMNSIYYRVPLEQYRPLLVGCWHGIDYKPYPRRTR
jgi:hypothetical protein